MKKNNTRDTQERNKYPCYNECKRRSQFKTLEEPLSLLCSEVTGLFKLFIEAQGRKYSVLKTKKNMVNSHFLSAFENAMCEALERENNYRV